MDRFNEIFELLHTDVLPAAELIVKDNIVLLGTAAFIIVMLYVGRERGFIDRILSLGSVMVTLGVEIELFPHIMNLILENQGLREFCLNTVLGIMKTDDETVSSPLYDLLGISTVVDNAAELMETLAAKVIFFVIIFAVLRLLFMIFAISAKSLKKIRLVNNADRILGMAVGGAEAFIFIWIFMLVISGLPNVPACNFMLKQIMHNDILLAIYNNNLLFAFAVKMLS